METICCRPELGRVLFDSRALILVAILQTRRWCDASRSQASSPGKANATENILLYTQEGFLAHSINAIIVTLSSLKKERGAQVRTMRVAQEVDGHGILGCSALPVMAFLS